jgi:F5/8 type C domain
MERRAAGHESALLEELPVKQNFRNFWVFSSFGVACLSASWGCSGDPATPIGGNFAGTFTQNTSGTTTGTAGTAVVPSGGTQSTTGGTFGSGGTFGTAGTFSTSGTFGTAGTDTGGVAAGGGGAGGTGTAAGTGGTAAGTGGTAAGGTGAGDFPANCAAPTGAHGATPLTRSCWALTASDCAKTAQNMNPPLQAIDAAGATTRFSTGATMATSKAFSFQINLGSAVMVNGVQIVSGGTKVPMDFAPQLEVAVSTDGTNFTSVACGDGALTTDFSFAPVSAQYIKLVQHGIADSWWSIHDLNVYSSTGDSCAVAGTQTETCTLPHTQ